MSEEKNKYPKKLIGDYYFCIGKSQIAQSHTSIIHIGYKITSGEKIILKITSKKLINETIDKLINLQIKVMEELIGCSYIVQIYDSYQSNNNIYIAMEYCKQGDLYQYFKKRNRKLSENQAMQIMDKILMAYKQIYQKKIIHRDLKLSNIFITDGDEAENLKIKIGDFGYSILCSQKSLKSQQNVGSPFYMPPESLAYNLYSYKSDIWSLGIMYYELLFGQVPWSGKTQQSFLSSVRKSNINDFTLDGITQISKHFIRSCLTKTLRDRFQPQELVNFSFFPKIKMSQRLKTTPSQKNTLTTNYRTQKQPLPKIRSQVQLTYIKEHFEQLNQQQNYQKSKTRIYTQNCQIKLNFREKYYQKQLTQVNTTKKKKYNRFLVKKTSKYTLNNQEEEDQNQINEKSLIKYVVFYIQICRFMHKFYINIKKHNLGLQSILSSLKKYVIYQIQFIKDLNFIKCQVIENKIKNKSLQLKKTISICQKYYTKYHLNSQWLDQSQIQNQQHKNIEKIQINIVFCITKWINMHNDQDQQKNLFVRLFLKTIKLLLIKLRSFEIKKHNLSRTLKLFIQSQNQINQSFNNLQYYSQQIKKFQLK